MVNNSKLLPKSLKEGVKFLKNYKFYRPPYYSTFYDFDSWIYSVNWPNLSSSFGSLANSDLLFSPSCFPPMYGRCSLVVDDLKYSYNAWSMLRLALYYSLPHPRVLTGLENTTPSMAPDQRGNILFYHYCETRSKLDKEACKVALIAPTLSKNMSFSFYPSLSLSSLSSLPNSSLIFSSSNSLFPQKNVFECQKNSNSFESSLERRVHNINEIDWKALARGEVCKNYDFYHNRDNYSEKLDFYNDKSAISDIFNSKIKYFLSCQNQVLTGGQLQNRPQKTVELVLGMENGMRDSVRDQCDFFITIPQYGSVGSLSMMSAAAIALHSAHSQLHPFYENNDVLKNKFLKGRIDRILRFLFENKRKKAKIVKVVDRCKESKKITYNVNKDNNNFFKSFTPQRPHHEDLLGYDDAAITNLLSIKRQSYPLQLSLLWFNECADRNIGACVRNGNVFNIEKFVILNRKKFSRRGTVGTHNYMKIIYGQTVEDVQKEIDGYVLWVLHPDYPFLVNHLPEIHPKFILPPQKSKHDALNRKKCTYEDDINGSSIISAKKIKDINNDSNHSNTFIRHEDELLTSWLNAQLLPTERHPMYGAVYHFNSRGDEDVKFNDDDIIKNNNFSSSDNSTLDLLQLGGAGQQNDNYFSSSSPFSSSFKPLSLPDVYLDDPLSVLEAVIETKYNINNNESKSDNSNKDEVRGIMLVVCEEGSTPHWHLLRLCQRVVRVVNPKVFYNFNSKSDKNEHNVKNIKFKDNKVSTGSSTIQRGLTPAMSTAIALERLRWATSLIAEIEEE